VFLNMSVERFDGGALIAPQWFTVFGLCGVDGLDSVYRAALSSTERSGQ